MPIVDFTSGSVACSYQTCRLSLKSPRIRHCSACCATPCPHLFIISLLHLTSMLLSIPPGVLFGNDASFKQFVVVGRIFPQADCHSGYSSSVIPSVAYIHHHGIAVTSCRLLATPRQEYTSRGVSRVVISSVVRINYQYHVSNARLTR